MASFSFPDFDRSYEMVALVHPDEYAMNEGELRSTAGLACPVTEFEQRFEEYQVPHSTALQARRRETGTCYLVGPLARVALSRERLAPRARALADELLPEPATNVFRGIVARAVEVVHAFEEALELLRHYRPVWPPRVPWQPREGTGCAATEAPRGTLYHRYRVSADGTVAEARIVPPTSQNQAQIEDDLRAWVREEAHRKAEGTGLRDEPAMRGGHGRPESLALLDLEPGPGLVAALAAPSPLGEVHCFDGGRAPGRA